MNWISNYVRPTINSLFSRREVPDNLWTKCAGCGTMLFHRELSDNLNVCTNCDHHMPISARDRLMSIFDAGIFVEVDVPEPTPDPLQFRDQKKYTDRIKDARKKTGEKDAMLVAEGAMGRTNVVVAVQDFSFMGGSMSMYVGNAIVAAAERAIATGTPLILFSAAGGARMQEGILGEPNALIGFAGARVIEQTIGEKLPEGFQRAEYLLDHGMLDRVTPRTALKDELVAIVRMLTGLDAPVKGDLPAPEIGPVWWPAFCAAFDIVAGVAMVRLIQRGKITT